MWRVVIFLMTKNEWLQLHVQTGKQVASLIAISIKYGQKNAKSRREVFILFLSLPENFYFE